ncbi:MAG: anthranilate synthase component I family protein [Crocinitomicaceae bacterium]|nr:anthranilate synthase component I family protein [Crocinitomicaceae bacterium]
MNQFPVSYLNSNNGISILAFGEGPMLKITETDAINSIQNFIDNHSDKHIFMCLSYDLKNDIESLESNNMDTMNFPKAILWVPETVVRFESEQLNFTQGTKNEESIDFIQNFLEKEIDQNYAPLAYELKPRTSKEDYLKKVELLKEEIQQGNIYEVNYCQEFYSENVELKDALNTYFKLNTITKAPYSSYMNIDDFILFCGSPENFILKKDNKIFSSPIKGTKQRGASPEEDEQLKKALLEDPKERAENVMIVDLVRNDLSRIAEPNTVKVDELFGIHTFETVHQMISTISCEVSKDVTFADILKATFPMGSMTGAPKISAMKLIEKHENFKRGIYSGSIGYLQPNGNFDLNVVIRTLIYNKETKYLSCPVGGAITIKSDPESEYEECHIKVKGILDQMNE